MDPNHTLEFEWTTVWEMSVLQPDAISSLGYRARYVIYYPPPRQSYVSLVIGYSSRKNPINASFEHISTTFVPVTIKEKPDPLEYAAHQGLVKACIIYQKTSTKCVFVFCHKDWHKKKTLVDNLKRTVMEARHVNEFRPDDVLWEETSKGLLKNPYLLLKATEKRMVYVHGSTFFIKKDFTFGFRMVKPGEPHVPDPPVDILGSILTDDASFDQLMSFVFGQSTQYSVPEHVIQAPPTYRRTPGASHGTILFS
ncbi:hypothetical protein TNCV_5002201 [Trichonephila clavipes]|nr:hypothetical protein TNCV_5002201 [Trichonephila clavipes]